MAEKLKSEDPVAVAAVELEKKSPKSKSNGHPRMRKFWLNGVILQNAINGCTPGHTRIIPQNTRGSQFPQLFSLLFQERHLLPKAVCRYQCRLMLQW